MVALAAIKLSPEDGRRLAALFKHNRCLFTLAHHTGQPIHELIHWATLPHIQRAIETVTRLENDAHRAAAIEALRSTLDKSEDLVEKRRAACAILRATAAPPHNLRRDLLQHSRGIDPPASQRTRSTAAQIENNNKPPREPPASARSAETSQQINVVPPADLIDGLAALGPAPASPIAAVMHHAGTASPASAAAGTSATPASRSPAANRGPPHRTR